MVPHDAHRNDDLDAASIESERIDSRRAFMGSVEVMRAAMSVKRSAHAAVADLPTPLAAVETGASCPDT